MTYVFLGHDKGDRQAVEELKNDIRDLKLYNFRAIQIMGRKIFAFSLIRTG